MPPRHLRSAKRGGIPSSPREFWRANFKVLLWVAIEKVFNILAARLSVVVFDE